MEDRIARGTPAATCSGGHRHNRPGGPTGRTPCTCSRRPASLPGWEDHLADHGLDREQQEGRQEHRRPEQPGWCRHPHAQLAPGMGSEDVRRRGRLSARRPRPIFYNTRKRPGRERGGGAIAAIRHRISREDLPCHFTDGSAAACDSGNTCEPTEKRIGRSRAAEKPWARHPGSTPTVTAAEAGSRRAPARTGRCRSSIASYTGCSKAIGGRSRMALLGLSLATLLKLIPPAATKAAIDYVLLARPLPPSCPGSGARSRSPSRPSSDW